MAKYFSTAQNNIWLPYHFALGPAYLRWFEGLKAEKILGNKCPKCNKVLVPARSFCPECNVDMTEWLEVSQEGQIVTSTLASKDFYGAPAKAPFVYALIRLDGVDCNFLHLVGGLDLKDPKGLLSKIARGTRVEAVWNEEKKGHMLDLKYFQPVN
jgi:uncharacterized OB-fold protein